MPLSDPFTGVRDRQHSVNGKSAFLWQRRGEACTSETGGIILADAICDLCEWSCCVMFVSVDMIPDPDSRIYTRGCYTAINDLGLGVTLRLSTDSGEFLIACF